MSVVIQSVEAGSIGEKKGIKSGYTLISINKEEINDVLDYQFYIQSTRLVLELLTDKNKPKRVKIKKDEYDDIGLEFDTYLMDKESSCTNKCVFCFIDQMPEGMRESLYFKDDDSRLSFLFGNYITLTNMSDKEVDRIIKFHISPVNISVHTMNPELRNKMMKNRFAGRSLAALEKFAKAGISMNTQLVLCPGMNDGDELVYSLNELEKLMPSVQSIACVPVGLTKYRDGLPYLRMYTKEEAREVIDIVDKFSEKFMKRFGTRAVYCSDEFYITAGLPIPKEEYYEDYPQIENGVGLCRSLEEEFKEAASFCDTLNCDGVVSVATGVAAAPLIKKLACSLSDVTPKRQYNIYTIKNDFFGSSVTVAGLITARDLINQLDGKELGRRLLIPAVMLKRDEDVFLDDVTLLELQEKLNVEIIKVSNDGAELFEALTK